MGGKDSKQQEKKQQPQLEEEQQQEQEEQEQPSAASGQGEQLPNSVTNLIAMVTNKSAPQKANENVQQIIVGQNPNSSARLQQNLRFIEVLDLSAKVSERAKTDKGKSLKLSDAGQIKLISNILDLRFNRVKRQIELIRNLDNIVISELQWIIKNDERCIEFTLLDKAIKGDQRQDIKLKNKVIFYTTLSGQFIGVKVPPKKNQTNIPPSYYEQLESEMRFLWQSIKPLRSRSDTKKMNDFILFTSKNEMDKQTISDIYNQKWVKVIGSQSNQEDLWQVESDKGAKRSSSKSKSQRGVNQNVLFNSLNIESYYYQDTVWPSICQYRFKNQVLINVQSGVKLDFNLKIVIVKIQSNTDKLPQKAKKAVNDLQQKLFEKCIGEFQEFSQTQFGKVMISFQTT